MTLLNNWEYFFQHPHPQTGRILHSAENGGDGGRQERRPVQVAPTSGTWEKRKGPGEHAVPKYKNVRAASFFFSLSLFLDMIYVVPAGRLAALYVLFIPESKAPVTQRHPGTFCTFSYSSVLEAVPVIVFYKLKHESILPFK